MIRNEGVEKEKKRKKDIIKCKERKK